MAQRTVLINSSEFENLKVQISEYQKKEINKKFQLAELVEKYYPVQVFANISNYHNKNYFEHCFIQLVHEQLKIEIDYQEYRRKFSLTCSSINDLKNIGSSSRLDLTKPPKRIGVLSEKKLKDWITFYECKFFGLSELDAVNKTKAELFILSLKGLPVRWIEELKKGMVELNGLVYKFEILHGAVYQHIELAGGFNYDLETFKKLSDNQLKTAL